MAKRRKAGPRERWKPSEFGLLLPGYYFKAAKKLETWWIKRDGTSARSENGQLTSSWNPTDLVWIDIANSLYRDRITPTGGANHAADS